MKQTKNPLKIAQDYIEQHINEFHIRRLDSLDGLELHKILKRKNPYLYKAKNILTAQDLIKALLDAHLSSQEETIFGEFLEGLAVHINGKIYGGVAYTPEGIDLEFSHDGKHYLVDIKSGPNWGNSQQIKRMKANFTQAKRRFNTHRGNRDIKVICVNGCCYGRDNKPDKGEYNKYCGQKFWNFISGNEDLYLQIIEPLGHRGRERNDEFTKKYVQKINLLTMQLGNQFFIGGNINWNALVQFNSSMTPPPRAKKKK